MKQLSILMSLGIALFTQGCTVYAPPYAIRGYAPTPQVYLGLNYNNGPRSQYGSWPYYSYRNNYGYQPYGYYRGYRYNHGGHGFGHHHSGRGYSGGFHFGGNSGGLAPQLGRHGGGYSQHHPSLRQGGGGLRGRGHGFGGRGSAHGYRGHGRH